MLTDILYVFQDFDPVPRTYYFIVIIIIMLTDIFYVFQDFDPVPRTYYLLL